MEWDEAPLAVRRLAKQLNDFAEAGLGWGDQPQGIAQMSWWDEGSPYRDLLNEAALRAVDQAR